MPGLNGPKPKITVTDGLKNPINAQVGLEVYVRILYMRKAKVRTRRICADSPEPSLLNDYIHDTHNS